MVRPDPTGDNRGMPTFARPLAGRTPSSAPSSRSALPSAVTAFSLAALSCAALFLVARPDGAQNLPNGKPAAAGGMHRAASAKTAATGTVKAVSASGTPDRKGLDFYTSNVHDGMFSAPVPPRPKPPTPPVKVVQKAPVEIKVPLPVLNPFAEWSYTGTVHMGDITMALLENTRTKEGQYVKSGDSFMGAQVQSISDQMVTLTNAGKPSMLAKADTIIVTPLSQNAPGGPPSAGQPGQPQGGPAAMNPGMGAMPDASQGSITLPNGRVLTGDRAARYQQRLNRGFGGGGGGGGRRGGGGNNGNGG